jgi:ABC-type multidrug transport system fused ATPase/permease subunit
MIRFLWAMRPYFRQVAGELGLGALAGIAMNTAVVLPALLLGHAIDEILAFSRNERSADAVAIAAALFIAATLATELPRIGKRWWLITANNRLRANIRADVLKGVLAWPMARLQRTPIGDLMARTIGDVEVLGVGLREFTIETWDTLLFSLSFVVAMLFLAPELTLVALLPVPLALLLAHASGRWVAARTTVSRQINAQLTASIQEQLAGLRVLKVFGRRAAAVEQVASLSSQQARANLALIRLKTGLQPAYGTLVTAGILAIVWLGGERVLAGAMSVGTFVAYLELFSRFTARAHRIPQLVNSVQSGAAAYTRLEPLLAQPLGVSSEPPYASFRPDRLVGLDAQIDSRVAAQRGPCAVSIRDVTFSYPGAAHPALRGLTLEIPAGAFVAFTGPVGCGKSALARLLAGVYPPDQGDMLIDGVAATEVPQGRNGYAPQHGYLFSGTLRDNVLLGAAADATQAIDAYVRLAGLEPDVRELPEAEETTIGELGIRLSGGQRLRLGLARAAAIGSPHGPGLLVLDDPFSAVDVDTETRLVANILDTFGAAAPLDRQTTVILFSHRLAAFPHADWVVVLDRGQIAECGSHTALLEQSGLYARIYRAQQQAEGLATAGARG